MHWIGTSGRHGKEAFEEFATKQCKVECSVLDSEMQLHDILDWPQGHAMTVFRTNQDGASVI